MRSEVKGSRDMRKRETKAREGNSTEASHSRKEKQSEGRHGLQGVPTRRAKFTPLRMSLPCLAEQQAPHMIPLNPFRMSPDAAVLGEGEGRGIKGATKGARCKW